MFILMIFISYLIGSISTAYFLGEIFGVDLTQEGTKNPGATNVFKVIGPGWGLFTAMTDLLKGIIPTYIAKEILNYNMLLLTGVALGAIIGHNWPWVNNFNGGRGLATTLGSIIVINLPQGLLAFVLGVGLTAVFRKKYRRNVRICFLVYPIFTAFSLYPVFNIYKLIYGVGITSIAGIRAWQLKDR